MTATRSLPAEAIVLPRIPNVRLDRIIGRGETSEVYLGLHLPLNRQVAVKVIHAYLADLPEVVARFQQEASAAAGLRHPNIIQVYDHQTEGGRPYMVMEYLPGPTLAEYLETGARRGARIPWKTTVQLIAKLADALDFAHRRGIIHRDVKPGNVGLRSPTEALLPNRLLPADAEPVLMDFGVARLSGSALRTATGAFIGTPAYMSPEQVMGEVVDARSDLYSLGVVFYQMLAGHLPAELKSESVTAVMYAHLEGRFANLPDPVRHLEPILERCLARDKEKRYASAADLAAHLRHSLTYRVNGSRWENVISGVALNIQELRASLLGSRGSPPTQGQGDAVPDSVPTRTIFSPRLLRRILLGDSLAESGKRAAQGTVLNFHLLRNDLLSDEKGTDLPNPPPRRRRAWLLGAIGLMAVSVAGAWGLFGSGLDSRDFWARFAGGRGTGQASPTQQVAGRATGDAVQALGANPSATPTATRLTAGTTLPGQMPTSTKTQPAASPTSPPGPTSTQPPPATPTSIVPPLPTLPLPTLPVPTLPLP